MEASFYPRRSAVGSAGSPAGSTPHIEKHFTAGATVRDVVIGMADGLTVPFALAAGLSGAVAPTIIIVTAGLAEIAAGSIAMGLGGYLAARSDAEQYARESSRERAGVRDKPFEEEAEIHEVFRKYGLTEEESGPIVAALRERPEPWIDFMMRFELGLEQPDPKRALVSAVTIGGAYVAGGFISGQTSIADPSGPAGPAPGGTWFYLVQYHDDRGPTGHGTVTAPWPIEMIVPDP